MEIKLYYLLHPDCQKLMKKTKKRWGHPYDYRPRGVLLNRLSAETGMSTEQVYAQLMKEREYILQHPRNY